MTPLDIYLNDNLYKNEDNITNENILTNIVSLATIRNIDPQDLLTGLLGLYEFICAKEDIQLFLQDYKFKLRLFWNNMYELYNKKVWSIFDAESKEGDTSVIDELNLEENKITKVTPQFRRQLRKLIKESRNYNLGLTPGEIESVLPITDELNNKVYFITLNRTTGLTKRILRVGDHKFLEKALEKLGDANESGQIDMGDIQSDFDNLDTL